MSVEGPEPGIVVGLLVVLPEERRDDLEFSGWVVLPNGERSPIIISDVGRTHPIRRLVAEFLGRARLVRRPDDEQ